MIKKIVLTSVLTLSGSLYAADYVFDPDHTHARFTIDHFGTSTNAGGFYQLDGKLSFDAEAGTGSVDVTFPVDKLMTGIPGFDAHLRTADVFNMEAFPEIHFVSNNWQFADGKVSQVDGDLTIRGITHPVSLKATKFNCYTNPVFDTYACGGDFETTLDRTQWGLDFLLEAGIPKDVKVVVQIEAIKQ